MKNSNLALAFIFLLIFSLSSCGDEKTSNNPPSEQAGKTSPQAETKDDETIAKEKIEDILSSYYTDLAAEKLDEDKYFAPELDQFFSSKSIAREKVGKSIRNSFDAIEDRHITFDPRTLRVEKTSKGYVTEFKGESIHTRSEDGQTVNSSFNNQVSFNEDFKIIAYGDKKDNSAQTTRALPPKAESLTAIQQSQSMAKEVLKEFKTGAFNKTQSYIHPKYGFYLIGQPGAYSVPYHLRSFDEVFKKAPWLEKGTDMYQDLKSESIPTFTCEGDNYFDKNGCFIEESGNYTSLTNLMKALRQAEFDDFGPEVVSKASNIERLVKIEVVETKSGTAFYYGEEAGKWYLLVIDMASYNCSA